MIFTHASLLARKTAHFALANSFVFGVYGYQILGESEGGANEGEEGEKRGENVHFGWFLVWNMLEVVVCGLKEELLLERNGGFIYFGDGYV
jgi:hypothetical protein